MPSKPKRVKRPWQADQVARPWNDSPEFGDDPFYHTPAWRRLRAAHIAREPLCRECAKLGRVRAGQVVDHIVARSFGGAELDDDNLQTLCHKCHNRKRGQEKAEHARRNTKTQ